MIQGAKIGCGITTFRRMDELTRLCESLPAALIDALVIVNDDPDVSLPDPLGRAHLINNSINLGVGKSKNKALRWLLEQGVEHVFLLEDDVFIKDQRVFERYIEASRLSGIQHFNHCPFGPIKFNLQANGMAAPSARLHLSQGLAVELYTELVAPFSYYSRHCLEVVGLFDERYYNAVEHVEHTLRIIKAGMHPPFWFFADIADSQDFLGGDLWSPAQSVIARTGRKEEIWMAAHKAFEEAYGFLPHQQPLPGLDELMRSLLAIRQRFGQSQRACQV